jgi:hypothetical protein
MTHDIGQVIQDLHDSEINGEVRWFYDGGWRVRLGDPSNGYDAEGDGVSSLARAVELLRIMAVKHYPDSVFAKKYRRGFE